MAWTSLVAIAKPAAVAAVGAAYTLFGVNAAVFALLVQGVAPENLTEREKRSWPLASEAYHALSTMPLLQA